MTQALLDIACRPRELRAEPFGIAAQLRDLARLVRKDCGHVLLAASPQDAIPGLYVGEAQLGAHGDGDGENRSTERDDDQRRRRCLLYTSPSPRDGLLAR